MKGYTPWVYDERQRWWTAQYGGLLASVTWMEWGKHWVAGFNGKPLDCFYERDRRIIDHTSFDNVRDAIEAINLVVSKYGFETLPLPEGLP